jgi:hypothetical protein
LYEWEIKPQRTDVIVGTMTRAEPVRKKSGKDRGREYVGNHIPATEISSLANGYTSQMSANTQHDQPLWVLRPSIITFGITESLPVGTLGLLNLIWSSVTDEHGLSTPFDDRVLSFRNTCKLDLDLGHSENVGGCGHGSQEFGDSGFGNRGGEDTERSDHEVLESPVGRRGSGLVTGKVGNIGSILSGGRGMDIPLLWEGIDGC